MGIHNIDGPGDSVDAQKETPKPLGERLKEAQDYIADNADKLGINGFFGGN